MSRVEVEPRGTKVMLRKLKALAGKIEDPTPMLESVGDVLRKETTQRFWKSESPTGKPWKRSKAAKRKRRRTLVRTGDLRDSLTYKVSDGKVEVGTDIYYGRIHQSGGVTDAEYKAKAGKTKAPSYKALPLTPPDASSAARVAAAAVRRRAVRRRQARSRRVRLPARRFLGVSKRDRKRTLAIMLTAMEEALR